MNFSKKLQVQTEGRGSPIPNQIVPISSSHSEITKSRILDKIGKDLNGIGTASHKLARGFLMVEAIVAISALVVGMLAIFTILTSSLGFNQTLVNKHIAASLAGEGIELVKNIIDTNYLNNRAWNTGLAAITYGEIDYDDTALASVADSDLSHYRFLKYNLTSGFYGYNPGSDTIFKRTITLTSGDEGDSMEVDSYVTWLDRGGARFEVKVADKFYNWR